MGSVTTIVVAGAAGWLAVSAVVAATLGRIIHRADELATGRALRPAFAVASHRGAVGVVVPITAARSAHQQRNRVIA